MKIIIAGTRTASRKHTEDAIKASRIIARITEVVCGMAAGADQHGRVWALKQGIRVAEFPADWSRLGRSAGPLRNRLMAEYADGAIIVWDRKSKGSQNLIQHMFRENKPFYVYTYDDPQCSYRIGDFSA